MKPFLQILASVVGVFVGVFGVFVGVFVAVFLAGGLIKFLGWTVKFWGL